MGRPTFWIIYDADDRFAGDPTRRMIIIPIAGIIMAPPAPTLFFATAMPSGWRKKNYLTQFHPGTDEYHPRPVNAVSEAGF